MSVTSYGSPTSQPPASVSTSTASPSVRMPPRAIRDVFLPEVEAQMRKLLGEEGSNLPKAQIRDTWDPAVIDRAVRYLSPEAKKPVEISPLRRVETSLLSPDSLVEFTKIHPDSWQTMSISHIEVQPRSPESYDRWAAKQLNSSTTLLSPTGIKKIKEATVAVEKLLADTTLVDVNMLLSPQTQETINQLRREQEASNAAQSEEDLRTPLRNTRREAMRPLEAQELFFTRTISTKKTSRLKTPPSAAKLFNINSVKRRGGGNSVQQSTNHSVKKAQNIAKNSLTTPSRARNETNSVKKVPLNALDSTRLITPKRFGFYGLNSFSATTSTPRTITGASTSVSTSQGRIDHSARESKVQKQGKTPFVATVKDNAVQHTPRFTTSSEEGHNRCWQPADRKKFFATVFKHLPQSRTAQTRSIPGSFSRLLNRDLPQLTLSSKVLPADAIEHLVGVDLSSEEGSQLAVLLALKKCWGAEVFNAFFGPASYPLTLGKGTLWTKILFDRHKIITEEGIKLGDRCTFSDTNNRQRSMFCEKHPFMENITYVEFGRSPEEAPGTLAKVVERIDLELVKAIGKMSPSMINSDTIAKLKASSRKS